LSEFDVWTYLEDFLLHFRNLIEFLGSESPRNDDLHILTICKLMNFPEPANLDKLHEKGKKLRAKYEPSNAKGGGRISQYLQHCTKKRIDAKKWEIGTMSNEIEPLLIDIEAGLGPDTGILKLVPPIGHLTLRAFGSPVCFEFIEDDKNNEKGLA